MYDSTKGQDEERERFWSDSSRISEKVLCMKFYGMKDQKVWLGLL